MKSVTTPSALRVGIDGFNLSLGKGTGVATYARTLSYALTEMGHPVDVLYGLDVLSSSSDELREVRFFDRLDNAEPSRRAPPFSKQWIRDRKADLRVPPVHEIAISGRVDLRPFGERLPMFDRLFNAENLFRRAARHFRRTGCLTSIRMEAPPAVMHWTYPLPVRLEGAANVYTLHDLVPLRLPYTTLDDKPYYHRLIDAVCRNADALCTVSEASKKDILSFFPSVEDKLHNTYQSFRTASHISDRTREQCEAEIMADFGLEPASYFMFFGSLEPKKNIGRLIEGFLASGCSRRLVLVGAMAWKSERELRYLDRGIAAGRIVSIDYLPERTLFSLLRLARAVLFPSLCEGFGLPVLEAMNFGVPALISREGALPEIGGDAALQTDAYDVDAIASAIFELDHDDALCGRLVAAGWQQAERFNMASYRERLDTLYTSALHRKA